MVQFDEAGKKAEQLAVEMYGLTFITDLSQQYEDIDCVDSDGYTYSVKDQMFSSSDYGSITPEYELGTTKSYTDRREGNLLTNQTDMYLWLVTYKGQRGFLGMASTPFKEFVLAGADNWVKRSLKAETARHNSNLGRHYNLAWSYAVPVDVLVQQKEWCLFEPIPEQLLQRIYFNNN